MKRHRFFIDPCAIQGRFTYIEDDRVCGQIARVLRLKAGEEVMLLDGLGFEYAARLTKIGSRGVSAEILQRQMNKNEAELKITLYQSLVKKDKFEWVLQKCTEVGVASFVPVRSARSEKLGFNTARAEKIIMEAAEQSERGIVPEIGEVQDVDSALRRACRGDIATIFLDHGGDAIKNFMPGPRIYAVNVFVGPEGGWSEEELHRAREMTGAGCELRILNIGSTILRTETAGLVAAAILLHATT